MALTEKQKLDFIAQCAPLAQATQDRYGLPASVTIAQAAHETGFGTDELSRKANNFFGIKAFGKGITALELPTSEFIDGKRVKTTARWRVFASMKDCFDWRGKWLSTSPLYAAAYAERGDYFVFAQKLAEKYATDPGYVKKLLTIVDQFKLWQYDTPVNKKEG